jgi:hypothetical protein
MCVRTDTGIQLEKERQRLSDSTGSTQDRNFRELLPN